MPIDGFTKVCVSVAALCAVGLGLTQVSDFARRVSSQSDREARRWPGAKFDWADVAGTYVMKDNPTYETLAVLSSGTLVWNKVDATTEQTVGEYGLKGDQMIVVLQNPAAIGPPMDRYDSMYPLRWGDRMYLVPEGKSLDYVHWVQNGAKGFPSGLFFERLDPKTNQLPDESKPPAGKPQVPAKYRPYMDPPQVVSVSQNVIKINEGGDEGFTHDTVLAPGFKGTERYRVVSVFAHSAIIAPFGKYAHELKVGDKLQLSDGFNPPAPRKIPLE